MLTAAPRGLSVSSEGGMRPLSNRATTDCVVFIRAASAAQVRPAWVRARISALATSYSGPRAGAVAAGAAGRGVVVVVGLSA